MSHASSIQRLLRQVVLTELGLRAAAQDGVATLAAHTARAVADACAVPLVGVFELRRGALHLLAGIGWPPHLAEQAIVCADDPYLRAVLASDAPVPLEGRVPQGLAAAGAEAGLTARVGPVDAPLGVLGVYEQAADGLDDEVPEFLDAVAQVLARALEQAHTEAALRESEARIRAILDGSAEGLLTFEHDGVIESANPAAARIFGYESEGLLGKHVSVLLPPRPNLSSPNLPSPNSLILDGSDGARPVHSNAWSLADLAEEAVGCRRDGTTFPMALSVSEVTLSTGSLFTAFVRDISEQRALEIEVLRIADQERRRIGQDLHDGLGQMLTGITLIAQSVARKVARGEQPPTTQADEVVTLLREADAYARGLARGLVPVDLEVDGLLAALRRLAANAAHFFEVACTAERVGEPPDVLPDALSLHLFRIAQEAVSNAVYHGHAEHIEIRLTYEANRVTLRVSDDGRGYPASPPSQIVPSMAPSATDEVAMSAEGAAVSAEKRAVENRGMGVRIMRHRARVLGGRFEIRPREAGGTLVTCTVPLDHVY